MDIKKEVAELIELELNKRKGKKSMSPKAQQADESSKRALFMSEDIEELIKLEMQKAKTITNSSER
jgi:hypothetical protein